MRDFEQQLKQQLKLVIFDCDGTLVDSQAMIVRAMQQAFLAHHIAAPDRQSIKSIIGLSLEEAVQRLRGSKNIVPIDALCEAYKVAFVHLREQGDMTEPLFSGARAFLTKLSEREDVVLGVATGKSRRGVDVLFEREDLHGFFSTIQTADSSPSKPHPGMIEQAMAQTGVRCEQTYMIGDTSFDMEMAINAKVGALGVSWGYHARHELTCAGAHGIADDFPQLENLMPTIFQRADELEPF